MADKLSLPNLLSLLQVDQQSDVIIRELHDNSERLRRRHRYEDAIKAAQDAVLLVRNEYRFNYILYGVTLLYLSAARLSYNRPEHNTQAIHNCDEAITYLHFHPHNLAIAEIIRAHIELQECSDGPKSTQHALAHLQRSAQILLALSTDWRVPGDLKQIESELLDAVNDRISRLTVLQSDIPPISDMPKQPSRLAPTTGQAVGPVSPTVTSVGSVAPPVELHVPTRLVWPVPDAVGLQFVSVHDAFLSSQGLLGFDPVQDDIDYIEINQFWINGKPYMVHPLTSTSGSASAPRLYKDMQYTVIQMSGNGETCCPDQYVLVRCQDSPLEPGEEAVFTDPSNKQAWVDVPHGDSVIRIIGGEVDPGKNQNERIWTASENQPPKIIGVVEAVLTPLTSSAPLPRLSFLPPTVNIDQLNKLIDCVDSLHNAEGFGQDLDEGIKAIHEKFQNYLVQTYDLQPLPIILGQTEFDPQLGHYASHSENRLDKPPNTIVKVIRDGYLYKGQLLRQAEVVVNR